MRMCVCAYFKTTLDRVVRTFHFDITSSVFRLFDIFPE